MSLINHTKRTAAETLGETRSYHRRGPAGEPAGAARRARRLAGNFWKEELSFSKEPLFEPGICFAAIKLSRLLNQA